MNNSIRKELLTHIIECIEDRQLTDMDELHYHCFNEDYYIIGYYKASEWLKQHDVDAFEAIGRVIEWEYEAMGETTLKAEDINSENIVNKYIYALGEELLNEFNLDDGLLDMLKNDLFISTGG